MVKSQKKREKYASSSTLFTLFGLFTMSKKLTCRKKLPFHCAHTKLFTLNFIFHWISWFKYSILFTTFGVIKSTLNSIFYQKKWPCTSVGPVRVRITEKRPFVRWAEKGTNGQNSVFRYINTPKTVIPRWLFGKTVLFPLDNIARLWPEHG